MKTTLKLIGLLVLTQLSSAFAITDTKKDDFLSIVDESIKLREEGISYYEINKGKFGKEGNLSHGDIEDIYKFSSLYLKNRERIFKYINNVTSEIGPKDKVVFTFNDDTGVKDSFFSLGKKHIINLKEEAGLEKLRDIKIATAFGLMLYDNYLALISPYYSHSKIRYMLNQDFPEGKDKLDAITESFFSSTQRRKFFQGLEIFNNSKTPMSKVGGTDFDLYLDRLIETSPMLQYLKSNGTIESRKFTRKMDELFDNLNVVARFSTYQTSKLFGNTMGIFQTRSGLLKNLSTEEKTHISNRLRPLDILLEKTPFRLTDSFIPGYYGHVAIWVGTESELRELGLWDHPLIKPHQKKIQEGHSIIEALRPGVEINTLEHFLDIDDLAVLRPNHLGDQEVEDYLIRAFAQIGKFYDFNFDVETDREIVCSEIAYVVYHNVTWPTDRTLGRATISPDHVAWKALPGKEFTPVILYKNGKEVEKDIEGVFKSLITGPEGLKGAELELQN